MSRIARDVEANRAEWKRRYLEGASLNDIRCAEAAAGRRTCEPVIRRTLIADGVTLRTKAESLALMVANRKQHGAESLAKRRAAR